MFTVSKQQRALQLIRQIEEHRKDREITQPLKELMVLLGFRSKGSFAIRIGVSYGTVCRWSNKQNSMPQSAIVSLYNLAEEIPTGGGNTSFVESREIPKAFLEALLDTKTPTTQMLHKLFEVEDSIGHFHINLTKEQAVEIIKSAD